MIVERTEAKSNDQIRRLSVYGAASTRCFSVEICRVTPRSADFGVPYIPTAKCSVRWNANRGRGWMVGWKKTFANETEARTFAEEKIAHLTSWLETGKAA